MVPLCGIWRKNHARNRSSSCKVNNNNFKEKCTRLVDKMLLSSTTKDRLSELPDDILSHILTSLTLRDVARMAMLSRKWRNLCLDLTSLDLDWFVMSGMPLSHSFFGNFESYKRAYVNNVDQVLENYKDRNILSFRMVSYLRNNHTSDVDRWMNFATNNKNLRSLSLYFTLQLRYTNEVVVMTVDCKFSKIRDSFLSEFSHLKSLRLRYCIMELDNDFRFSNLTKLDLDRVHLEGTKWELILSSISSSIECLRLVGCNLPSKMCFGDEFARLSVLIVAGCAREFDVQEVELSSRNLKTFEFCCENNVTMNCSFLNVPCLESVHLYMFKSDFKGEDIAKNLAAHGPSLKHLLIVGYNLMTYHVQSLPERLFHSVTSLGLHHRNDNANYAKDLPRLLEAFPQLKKLELKLPKNHHEPSKDEVSFLYPHTNLKEVVLSAFGVEWMHIANYLLQSGVSLDRMVLTKSFKELDEQKLKLQVVISMLFSKSERESIQKSLIQKPSSTNVEVIIVDNFCKNNVIVDVE